MVNLGQDIDGTESHHVPVEVLATSRALCGHVGLKFLSCPIKQVALSSKM